MKLLLLGGGHAHLEALRRLAMAPAHGLDIVLVTPRERALYSGMVPGVIAGHFAPHEAAIALPPLAAAARARLVTQAAVGLELDARRAWLDDGTSLGFDVMSLNVGGAAVPGDGTAIGVKPLDRLIDRWTGTLADIAAGGVQRVCVVGGGAAGVELVCAMHHRTSADRSAATFTLVTDGATILTDHPDGAARHFLRLFAKRGIALVTGCRLVHVGSEGVECDGGRRIEAQRVFVATGAVAPRWLAASGLACDAEGFVRIDATLRSVSHPFVFAAGDCASGEPVAAKAGVHAVRQGAVLAQNFDRLARERPLAPFVPRARSLALISAGSRHAVATFGRWAAHGAWAWTWKTAIDRRHVARYRHPPGAAPEYPAAD